MRKGFLLVLILAFSCAVTVVNAQDAPKKAANEVEIPNELQNALKDALIQANTDRLAAEAATARAESAALKADQVLTLILDRLGFRRSEVDVKQRDGKNGTEYYIVKKEPPSTKKDQ